MYGSKSYFFLCDIDIYCDWIMTVSLPWRWEERKSQRQPWNCDTHSPPPLHTHTHTQKGTLFEVNTVLSKSICGQVRSDDDRTEAHRMGKHILYIDMGGEWEVENVTCHHAWGKASNGKKRGEPERDTGLPAVTSARLMWTGLGRWM